MKTLTQLLNEWQEFDTSVSYKGMTFTVIGNIQKDRDPSDRFGPSIEVEITDSEASNDSDEAKIKSFSDSDWKKIEDLVIEKAKRRELK